MNALNGVATLIKTRRPTIFEIHISVCKVHGVIFAMHNFLDCKVVPKSVWLRSGIMTVISSLRLLLVIDQDRIDRGRIWAFTLINHYFPRSRRTFGNEVHALVSRKLEAYG